MAILKTIKTVDQVGWWAAATGALLAGTAFVFNRYVDWPRTSSNGVQSTADATYDELYDMAKKADVSGRSTMNKEELVDALNDNE